MEQANASLRLFSEPLLCLTGGTDAAFTNVCGIMAVYIHKQGIT
jgi:hypothetical protein